MLKVHEYSRVSSSLRDKRNFGGRADSKTERCGDLIVHHDLFYQVTPADLPCLGQLVFDLVEQHGRVMSFVLGGNEDWID